MKFGASLETQAELTNICDCHDIVVCVFPEKHPSEGREWGVGSVVVGSAFGWPQIFVPNGSETLQRVLGRWTENWGAPKRRFNDHGANTPFSAL